MFYDQKTLYLRRCCSRYPRPNRKGVSVKRGWTRGRGDVSGHGATREGRGGGERGRWNGTREPEVPGKVAVMYLALSPAKPRQARPGHATPCRASSCRATSRHSWLGLFYALSRYHACTYGVYVDRPPVVRPRSRSFVIVAVRCTLPRGNGAIAMPGVRGWNLV